MTRSILALTLVLPLACQTAGPAADDPPVATAEAPLTVTRDLVADGVYHYTFVLRVGVTANARLVVHRIVRAGAPAGNGVMLLHGDFSTFATNFAPSLGTPPSTSPGLAVFLAERGIDVWGFDRRWTQAPAQGADLSDFGAMGLAAEMDDIGRALAFARVVRHATGGGGDRLTLVGFSRGGQLAYLYAAIEAARPPGQRFIKGLVPLDVYADIAPDDAADRQTACANRDQERAALAAGVVDTDNSIFVALGALDLSAPADPSPIFPGLNDRDAFLFTVAQTYLLFAPTPTYHLAAGVFDPSGVVTGLRESPEAVVATWFAAAAPHQSLREVAESDAMWCGSGDLPLDAPLEQIRVPLFYLGAAGGFGDHGLYSTTRVSSTDVTSLVVRRFAAGREAEDFGHGDLLYATDAEALAWTPLVDWLVAHEQAAQ